MSTPALNPAESVLEPKPRTARPPHSGEGSTRFAPGAHKFLADALRSVVFSMSEAATVFRKDGFSTYRFLSGGMEVAEFSFAPLLEGGFLLRKAIVTGDGRKTWFEEFNESGELIDVRPQLDNIVMFVDLIDMEPQCPIVSHLYDTLSHEYRQADSGHAKIRGMAWMEGFLRQLDADDGISLSVEGLSRDAALIAYRKKEYEVESDPVLNWSERQKHIKRLRAERSRIIAVKRRVHHLSLQQVTLPVWIGDLIAFGNRMRMNPGSNFRGFLHRYTIGVLIWFLNTVRSNIGYSIALAIYGPFTFYFITQPLNPQAMWAVGRVRSAYLELTESIKTSTAGVAATAASVASVAGVPTGNTPAPSTAGLVRRLGMPLSTENSGVDGQNWSDRMSRFKDMQIGYEEHMQFAARMGRLEHMETQLNFPLIAQSAWNALEAYISALESAKSGATGNAALQGYISRELVRSRRLELYVWDKLLRFLLDHPYVVMDQGSDQVYRDAYQGRVFVLMQEMTEELAAAKIEFQRPTETKRLEKLAALYRKGKVSDGGIISRVERNAKALPKKGALDGAELRAQLRRHWEVLYLLQNKAQEASNFGLQTYTWSVRNTVWIIAALHSSKARELELLLAAKGQPAPATVKEIKSRIEPEYESLYYNALIEFMSLEPELKGKLTHDLESEQRKEVIGTIREFLTDRESALLPVSIKGAGR